MLIISHPIFKTVIKFRNYPSINAIENLNKGTRFEFSKVSVRDVVKEIKKLSTQKATQTTNIPVKILKENADILEAISVILSTVA